jgi:hypothetical protein
LNNLQIELKVREKNLNEFGLDFQPLIITSASSVFDAKEYFIYFDRIFYRFDDIISCVDILFKLYIVSHFKYPEESKNFWLFLQKYFFRINTDVDSTIAIVEKVISLLNA